MISELIVTSVPRGLQAGRSGFTTVMRTKGMHPQLSKGLESLSAYRHVFAPGDPRNPRIRSHQVIQGPNGPVSVLSRIIDAGNDYSGRSNKLAHNIAIEGATIASRMKSTPAAVFLQLEKTGVFQQQWVGDPREQTAAPSLPMVPVEPGICRTWARIAGDAGWAGVLVDRALRKEPTWIIAPADVDLVELFAEALSLVNYHQRWGISFTSYAMGQGDALWLGTTDGSPEAQAARAQQRILVIDLTRRIPLSLNSPSIDAARGTASVPWKRDIAPTATPAGARPITVEPVSALRPEPSPITPAVTPLGGPRTVAYPTPGPPRIGPPNQAPPWIHEPPPTVTTTDWHDGQSAGKWPMLIWGIAITVVVMVIASTIIIFPEPVREIAMKVSQFVLPPAAAPTDKAAAEKTAVDKVAGDKNAADKVAADKDTTDKDTTDKAAADKAAADKAAADKAAADKVAEEKKPHVQRLCEAIDKINHLPQESLFSGTNNTNTFTLVEYETLSLRDFTVSLPHCPCDGSNPDNNFLYAKPETGAIEGLSGPTWEVRFVKAAASANAECENASDDKPNQKPHRLGKLVFTKDKLVFEKDPNVSKPIFDFLRLTCVVITGTEAKPSSFVSYLQLSKPVEIPPTVVTPPTELLFVKGTSIKALTTGTSIKKVFQFNDSILETLQVLEKFQKNNLVWTKATLRTGTTPDLSWIKLADEVSNTGPLTFEWKYKNDETQFLGWIAEWLPRSKLSTYCEWNCQNFPRIDWNIKANNKQLIYTQVLEKAVEPNESLHDTNVWWPFCQMFLRSNLPRDIQKIQKDNYSRFIFTRKQFSEDLNRSESAFKSQKTLGSDAIAARDKIKDQITKLRSDYPDETTDKNSLPLKDHIAFLKRILLEKPWPELMKSAKDKLSKEEPDAKEPEWLVEIPKAPGEPPPKGALKDELEKHDRIKKDYLAYQGFKTKKVDWDNKIDTYIENIFDDEVKEYLKQNEKKLSEGTANNEVFAIYCHCFLWDKLKDMNRKVLSKADSDKMVKGLGDAKMSINFDVEIRWDKAAFPFPEINPIVFTESKRRLVTVVIKTDEKESCLKPLTDSPLAVANVVPGLSSPDLDRQEIPESPANPETPFLDNSKRQH